MKFHYLELLKSFVVDLSWPIVTLIILNLFKDQIRYFLQNIKLFKALGGEIETHIPNQKSADLLSKGNDYLKVDPDSVEANLNKILNDFEQDTIETAKNVIIRETTLNNLTNVEDKVRILLNYSILVLLEKHFQNIYSYIYGSQIELLERLKTNNYETKDSLESIYKTAVDKSPLVYQSYSYGQYLTWLHDNGLLTVMENNNVIITFQGLDFLKFVEKRSFPKVKPIY